VTKVIRAGLARITIASAVLAGLAGGCSRGKQDQGGGGGFVMPPMPIQTADVTSGTVENRYSVVGTLAADDAITVVAEINAQVVALPFREGQPIARGALIAQLDDTELAADVERAAAQVAQRQSSFERIRTVTEQGAGTPQDLDDADASLKVARADLAMARARLAKTRITAPFAGVTGARVVSVGAYLSAGDAITTLARIDELRVNFTAPERTLAQLQPGAPVTITTTAYPDRILTGTIDVIDPSLDPGTRAAHIVARVANPDHLLRPGMSADVAVVLETRAQALTVPSEAIFVQAGQPMVYLVQADSTVAPRPVRLGLRETATVEVLEGLAPGDRVVRAGHQKLFPGAKVIPLPAAGAPPAAAAAPDSGGGA
jgi:membrane fusion protein, multidrug efflux system